MRDKEIDRKKINCSLRIPYSHYKIVIFLISLWTMKISTSSRKSTIAPTQNQARTSSSSKIASIPERVSNTTQWTRFESVLAQQRMIQSLHIYRLTAENIKNHEAEKNHKHRPHRVRPRPPIANENSIQILAQTVTKSRTVPAPHQKLPMINRDHHSNQNKNRSNFGIQSHERSETKMVIYGLAVGGIDIS